MAYSQVQQPKKQGFFSNLANPILRKMENKGEFATDSCATYSGIVGKTVFFLLLTVAGVALCFILHAIFAKTGGTVYHLQDAKNGIYDCSLVMADMVVMGIVVLISLILPFLAWFIQSTIPVTGSIYCIAQGVLVGYITVFLAPQYKFLSLLAMVITLALVAAMLFVYAKGIIKVTARFRGIVAGMFFGIILASLLFFILSLIPGIRNTELFQGVSGALNTPGLSIAISIFFVIIASLFMLVDFDTIQRCVENRMDKKYEWMAAWGLAYTIIYIYFKILRILIMIFGNRSSSK